MQEVEGAMDAPRFALAVGRRLGMGETRQPSLIDTGEFAVEIGGLRTESRRISSCACPLLIRAAMR
jgi:hypothetical protein